MSSVFNKIVEAADPVVPEAVALTDGDRARIQQLVEQQVLAAAAAIKPGTDRSQFKFPKDTFVPVKLQLKKEFSENKLDLAGGVMRELIKDYRNTIRYASTLKLMQASLAELGAQVQALAN